MNALNNSRSRVLRNLAIIFAILVVAFGLRFRQLGENEALASIRSVQESEGVPVETVVAAVDELSRWITLAGTVEGTTQYPVVSNNALPVVGIPVREGDRVRAGDVIIRLASGAPSPMYHSVDKSRAAYENALLETKRLRNLYAEGAISRSDLDAAETQLKVQAADLQDAEGSSALLASQAGIVASILVTEGEMVDTGKPLVWITSTDSVKLCFEAGSAQAMTMHTGQPARWLDPEGEIGGLGTVNQLDLMADAKTHLLSGEALFANPDGRLVPGLLVSFQVRTVNRTDALIVPTGCAVQRDGQDYVWVVTRDAKAELRPVRLGLRTSDRVEISEGLRAGERVVRHGQTLLSEGCLVKDVGTGKES